jgi:fatty-acid desaturase
LFGDGHHKYHHDNASDYRQPFPIWTNTFIKLIKSNQH